MKIQPEEAWKKVFGPVFIYLNSAESDDDQPADNFVGSDPLIEQLWEDAKIQVKYLTHIFLFFLIINHVFVFWTSFFLIKKDISLLQTTKSNTHLNTYYILAYMPFNRR